MGSEGKVSWKQITTPINDGDDICPFPDDVLALFKRIVGDDLKGDEFNYRKFMGLMARTMEMQTGNKAPIEIIRTCSRCKDCKNIETWDEVRWSMRSASMFVD